MRPLATKSALETSLSQKIEAKKSGFFSIFSSPSHWDYTCIIAEHFGFDTVQLMKSSQQNLNPCVQFVTRNVYLTTRFLSYLNSKKLEVNQDVVGSAMGIKDGVRYYSINLSLTHYNALFAALNIPNADAACQSSLGKRIQGPEVKKLSPQELTEQSIRMLRTKTQGISFGECYNANKIRQVLFTQIYPNTEKGLQDQVMKLISNTQLSPKFLSWLIYADSIGEVLSLQQVNRPSVLNMLVQQAITCCKGKGIPMVTNLGNAFSVGGCPWPSNSHAQEEGLLRSSNARMGMPKAYENIDTTACYENIHAAYQNSGLARLGGSYRVEDCTLFSSDDRSILSKDKWVPFHMVVVAAPNLRSRSPGDDDFAYYQRLKKFYSSYPTVYIREMADNCHAQYQHTLITKSQILLPGALGCGKFENPPCLVALIHMASLQYKAYANLTVVFAIVGNELPNAFKTVFKNYEAIYKLNGMGRLIVDYVKGTDLSLGDTLYSLFEITHQLEAEIESLKPIIIPALILPPPRQNESESDSSDPEPLVTDFTF